MYIVIMYIREPFVGASPLVSVIVPAYNATLTISKTLDSVFVQSYDNLEVVVVNDGSQDDTLEVLRYYQTQLSPELAGQLKIIDQENGGVSAARNQGVARSNGDLIAFIDADDLWAEDKTIKQVEQIMNSGNPSNVFSYTMTASTTDPDAKALELNPFIKALNIQDHFTNPSGWMLSRLLFDRVGGFDESISAMEDQDFLTMLARQGADFQFVDKPVAFYRLPEEGKNYFNWKESYLRYFEKHHCWLRDNVSESDFEIICDFYRNQYGHESVNTLLRGQDKEAPQSGYGNSYNS